VRLEERLAEFKQTEAALTFSSGYAAAVGTLGALLGKDDVVILDKLCHASLIDGARLSGATIRVFPHNSMNRLESHLRWARQRNPHGRVLVVTESVFSMDGDSPPLPDLVELKERYGAMLLLDEAHAIGVIGPGGRGLAAHLQLTGRIDLHMGTLSKALGASGGYICSNRRVIDLLINRARSFIYTTAPAPAIAAAALAAVDLLVSREGVTRQEKLRRNIEVFTKLLNPGRIPVVAAASAIGPVILGSASAALNAAGTLAQDGYFVPSIRYPTVPDNAARLRIVFSSKHTREVTERFLEQLRNVAGEAMAPVR